MTTLTSPSLCTIKVFPADKDNSWKVTDLLKWVAEDTNCFNALIDTGALITGFNNEEVARWILNRGLHALLCGNLSQFQGRKNGCG